MELLRKILFILAFFIISNGLAGQIYWNELKDADTIGYVLVSKIDGTFDTINIADFYPHFKVQGTVPLNGNKAGDYLFNTLTGDISVWDGDSTFAGTWRTIWDASAVAAAGAQTLTIDSTGRTFTIGITDANEVKFKDTVDDADADPTNEIQTTTSDAFFIDVTDGSGDPVLSSSYDGPVYRIWHENEKKTLHTLVSDWENSWYLLNERWESTTNTCGLSDAALFNNGDNLQAITDSCTFNLIYASTGNGITYNNGEFYFVPYADRNISPTDSVKIRTKDRDNIWTTRYYGPFEIIDSGPDSYGRVVFTSQFNYVKEWEITYYGSIDLAGLEYYYYRANSDIPIPSKMKSNIFYRDNTFLGGLGDQYFSFGTAGQLLQSDGTGIEWIDPYEFDSTGIYNYVDSLDLIYSNELNLLSNELNLLSSETGERVYDTYIENGFMTTGDNFNFTEFINNYRDDFLQVDTLLFDGRDAKFLKNIALPTGTATGIFIEGNNLFIVDKDLDSLFHYIMPNKYNLGSAFKNKAVGISSIGVSIEGLNFTENGKYVWFFEYNAGIKVCELSENYNIETMGTPVTYTPPYLERYTDLEFYNDGLGAFMTHYDRQVIDQFTMTEPYDFSTVTYDGQLALGFRPWSLQFYNGKLYITSYSTDILKEYSFTEGVIDKSNMVATGRSIPFGPAPCGIHIEDGLIYKSDITDDKVYIYTNISRDTLKTELYEKLDTSNYYSYSVEIKGNNVDTIRPGIATWLDGDVSYQWCTGDTLYTGWYRHELDFKPTLHDSIKPVFVIADTTSIRNVRLFLKQYQSETFDDSAIQERIDSVITIFVTHDTNDADTVIGNEYNTTLTLVGTELQLTDGGGTLTQELSSFLDNTDAQDLSLSVNTLSLTGDASTVDLSGYLDNTDAQTLSLVTNTLSISNGNSVSLAAYLDDTNLTQEEVQDYIGTMVTGNTETGITVTYDDANDEFDFIVTTVGESTTVGTGFDLSGYQIVADFNEFTTDISPEGDEYIIMYDVSGVTHEKIDIDDLATYIGSGELTTVGTGFSLAGYQINADFDAFTSDNTFSGTDEVVYLSFATHKKGTLAGMGAYMQANWGDGTGTDDQQQLVNFSTYYRLGNESQSGSGISIIPGSGISITGTTGSSGSITISATGGSDGNGLWDSGNNNSLMAAGITGYVNNYMSFYNSAGTGSPILWIDDATTDYVAVGTSIQSNSAIFNVGGIVDIAGNTWIDGFLTLGNMSGSPVALLGRTSLGIVTDDITIGDGLDFTSGTLKLDGAFQGYTWAQGGFVSSSTGSSDTDLDILSMSSGGDAATYFSYDAVNDRINIDYTGDYKITLSFTYTSSSTGDISGIVYVRKSGVNWIPVRFTELAASKSGTASKSEIHSLSSTDYISVYLDTTTAEDVTISDIELIIEKIPD